MGSSDGLCARFMKKKLTWVCDSWMEEWSNLQESRGVTSRGLEHSVWGPARVSWQRVIIQVPEIRTSSPSGVKTVILFLLIYWAILALVHRYSHCLNHGTTVRLAQQCCVLPGLPVGSGWPAGVPASPTHFLRQVPGGPSPSLPGERFLTSSV